ncbi:MAG: hypothetical protein AB7T38_11280 [Nitrospirales bacterium]
MEQSEANLQDDPRWGGNVPWFLRYPELELLGDYRTFFFLVSERIEQALIYCEMGFGAMRDSYSFEKFCTKLKTKSLLIFRVPDNCSGSLLVDHVKDFFGDVQCDTQTIKTKLRVFEIFLQLYKEINQENRNFDSFVDDIRKFMVATHLMIDIQKTPPLIIPIDQPLFHQEVFGKLLPVLHLRFPAEANSLVEASHRLIKESDSNRIFGDAFKALESISRLLAKDQSLLLSKREQVENAFPELHQTTMKTITSLAAHRGDQDGHGGEGPPINQMRYLLLQICNIALLLIETKENSSTSESTI